jgi:hypothetical protein
MDPLLPALGLGGAFLAGYLYTRWRVRYWERIAADCGVQVSRVSGWAWNLTLHGQAGKLLVRISGSPHNKGGTQIVVVIPGPTDFSKVSIRREYQAPWKTHEIETGSESFDQTFCVQGPERIALSLLDVETRGLLINANDALTTVGSRLEVVDGKLLAETVDRQLSRILPLLLLIGEHLAQPMDFEQRLVQNATQDPEAGVRLRAAIALGAQGRGILLDLAENLEDDAVSAKAISSLSRELPFESTKTILLRALSSHRPQAARACLETLGRGGDASAVAVLADVMENKQGELAAFAARALETAGGPAAEGPLLLALQRDDKDLQVATANVLGRIGSPAAVLPLKEAAERFAWDPEISRATRQAIAEIQSRLPGASPGQLSLAGAELGQLSLAQAEVGQLSIAADPAGQLSISAAEDPPEEA